MITEGEIIDRVLALAAGDDGVRAVIRTDLLPVREYLPQREGWKRWHHSSLPLWGRVRTP